LQPSSPATLASIASARPSSWVSKNKEYDRTSSGRRIGLLAIMKNILLLTLGALAPVVLPACQHYQDVPVTTTTTSTETHHVRVPVEEVRTVRTPVVTTVRTY